jgi:anaerobic selenocysteine-containing dehydrogenase
LGTSYGRGAATLPQWDLANADCILVMGSNMAENHPIAFRFALQAKERGATLIHVDPRFTRTSALCDIYAPLRPGSDIAFLGGIINYILEHDLWFKEYALAFTNLSTIIDKRFKEVARSRELLGSMPRVVEPEEEHAATPDEPRVQPCTCPRCGARMIIIEVFARGCQPRYRPMPALTSMRIDTS